MIAWKLFNETTTTSLPNDKLISLIDKSRVEVDLPFSYINQVELDTDKYPNCGVNTCVKFSGNAAYIKTNSTIDLSDTKQLTLTFWFKHSGGNDKNIISQGTFKVKDLGGIINFLDDIQQIILTDILYSLQINTWNFVVIRYDREKPFKDSVTVLINEVEVDINKNGYLGLPINFDFKTPISGGWLTSQVINNTIKYTTTQRLGFEAYKNTGYFNFQRYLLNSVEQNTIIKIKIICTEITNEWGYGVLAISNTIENSPIDGDYKEFEYVVGENIFEFSTKSNTGVIIIPCASQVGDNPIWSATFSEISLYEESINNQYFTNDYLYVGGDVNIENTMTASIGAIKVYKYITSSIENPKLTEWLTITPDSVRQVYHTANQTSELVYDVVGQSMSNVIIELGTPYSEIPNNPLLHSTFSILENTVVQDTSGNFKGTVTVKIETDGVEENGNFGCNLKISSTTLQLKEEIIILFKNTLPSYTITATPNPLDVTKEIQNAGVGPGTITLSGSGFDNTKSIRCLLSGGFVETIFDSLDQTYSINQDGSFLKTVTIGGIWDKQYVGIFNCSLFVFYNDDMILDVPIKFTITEQTIPPLIEPSSGLGQLFPTISLLSKLKSNITFANCSRAFFQFDDRYEGYLHPAGTHNFNNYQTANDNDWMIPNLNQWNQLFTYYGGINNAGTHLKGIQSETENMFWATPKTSGNNLFKAKGGGYFHNGITYRGTGNSSYISGEFQNMNDSAYFLTGYFYSDRLTNKTYNCLIKLSDSGSIEIVNLYYLTNSFNPPDFVSIRLVKNKTTLNHGEFGEYIGNDGKKIKTVCIGTQEWLQYNLSDNLNNQGKKLGTSLSYSNIYVAYNNPTVYNFNLDYLK